MNIISGIEFSGQINIGNIITVVVFLVGGLGAFYRLRESAKTNRDMIDAISKRINDAELEKVKVQSDTMWIFQLRRGLVEVEQSGLGKHASPIKMTDKANDLLKPMLPCLREFYKEIDGDSMGLIELAVSLEAKFGDELVDTVCNKVDVSESACLILAISQLRPIGMKTIREAKELAVKPIIEQLEANEKREATT